MDRIFHNAQHSDRILRLTADTMVLVSPDGVCLDISSQSDIWFLQEDFILGKNIFALLPRHTRKEVLADIKYVHHEQVKVIRNYTLPLPQGIFYFKCIMHPYDGNILCQYRDITERSTVKMELETANRKLKEAQKAAKIGQWAYNTGEKIIYFSGYTDLLTREEMQQMTLDTYMEIVLPEDRELLQQWLDSTIENGIESSLSYRVALDRQIYHLRLEAFNREQLYDDNYLLEGYIQNISEVLRKDAKIEQLNLLLQTIMNNIPAGIVVKDIENDFRHIYRNLESYNRSTITNNEDAIGKNDFELHTSEQARIIRDQDMQVAQTGEEFHEIIRAQDAQRNNIVLDKRKIKIQSESLSPLILSIEWNITELEQIKHQLVQAKEKAETSDRLKSAFLANMSHEIRTPLNAIVGFSRIIMECQDAEQRQEYYHVVQTNNERLLQLINEILDLSKIESGIVEFSIIKVRLHELCADIHDTHVFRCPPNVKLVFEESDKMLYVEADKMRLFQVLSNLIGNAMKFTSEGSISFGYKRQKNKILLYVRDTGLGIDPSKVDRVFERFVKVNNFAQGSGLGLSICKTIVERLGGEIWLESEPGKGTTFFFTLPAFTVEKVESDSTMLHADKPATLSGTDEQSTLIRKPAEDIVILVAEDTDSNFELIEAIIGKRYSLVRALDGIEAVTKYEEVKPDLILMDIKMPNLDGLEATRIIRELAPGLPIVAQSAYAYEQDQEAAMQAGCNAFIAKPIMQDELKAILRRWLVI